MMGRKTKTAKSIDVDFSSVVLLLVLPLVNAVLRLIYSTVAGDVLLVTYANILSVLSYILSSLSLYAGLGLLTCAVLAAKPIKKYPIMYFIGLMLVYAGDIVSNKLMMTDEAFAANLPMTLTTAALNILLEVILFVLTYVFVGLCVRRSGSTPTRVSLVAPIVCAANSLAWAIASTVVDLVTVGTPVNFGEVVYLLSPYLLIAVTFVGGFAVVRTIVGRARM